MVNNILIKYKIASASTSINATFKHIESFEAVINIIIPQRFL